jgi:hypothetical protein
MPAPAPTNQSTRPLNHDERRILQQLAVEDGAFSPRLTKTHRRLIDRGLIQVTHRIWLVPRLANRLTHQREQLRAEIARRGSL